MARRALLKGLGAGGAALALTGLAGCTNGAASAPGTSSSADPAAGSQTAVAASAEITAAGVDRALAALPGIIDRYLNQTTVPGLAFAVVYDGKVRYLEGFGVREVGKPELIDPDTVFRLASVSKPISSTVVAAALTKKLSALGWDDAVHGTLPGFRLADAWVEKQVTAADLFAHRSGLPDHSGNLLEDLGYDRAEILARHRFYPLRRFRDNYEYTNYGLTAGAEAIAVSAGLPWERLAQQVLFEPLTMSSSSYDVADLQRRTNRAAMHKRVDGAWVPDLDADYDPQAPAGSATSSLRDMAAWVSMLLAGGEPVLDTAQLQRIWQPAAIKPALPTVGEPASFYGLGWNVNYESTGELRASHSGGFGRGAATSVTVFPSKGLGIVGLTNGEPVALPEAITVEFTDHVRYGRSTQQDWVSVIAPYVIPPETEDQVRYARPATGAEDARTLSAYEGRYDNDLYGRLTVSARGDALSFTVGPAGHDFELQHYSGDEFFFDTVGEDDSGFSGAIFGGTAAAPQTLTITAWNKEKLGVFERA